jgi:hypothetical protein
MSLNFGVIYTFVNTKLIPAINAIMGQIPALLGATESDVNAALAAVTKIITDLQTDWNTLVAAVKSAT